jgi:hypothetical protein
MNFDTCGFCGQMIDAEGNCGCLMVDQTEITLSCEQLFRELSSLIDETIVLSIDGEIRKRQLFNFIRQAVEDKLETMKQ